MNKEKPAKSSANEKESFLNITNIMVNLLNEEEYTEIKRVYDRAITRINSEEK